MERMLAVVFDSADKARTAIRALERLQDESAIALHGAAIVTRHADRVSTIVDFDRSLPEGTMGGTAIGTLIGMLGGPVGLALGAATGFIVGATTDFARNRIDRGFADAVANALAPGKTAVVAEIDEESTDTVDASMRDLGGDVHRRALSDVVDERMNQAR